MSEQILEEKLKRIEANDWSIAPREIRQRLLKRVMGARLDSPAEYVILTGCHGIPGFVNLFHLIKLLNYYGIDYTFLSEETCCGSSLLDELPPEANGEDIKMYHDYARHFENRNIQRMRKLGARKLVTACPGCNTRYNQFYADGDVEVLYYTQLLAKYADGAGLDAKANFYEGCHKKHRTPEFKIDTETSKALVHGMRALDVTDLPNYCCRDNAAKIFARADTGTIVTPTSCCWSFLTNQAAVGSPRILSLTQFMCQALGIA